MYYQNEIKSIPYLPIYLLEIDLFYGTCIILILSHSFLLFVHEVFHKIFQLLQVILYLLFPKD
jgi:hypothetical protein